MTKLLTMTKQKRFNRDLFKILLFLFILALPTNHIVQAQFIYQDGTQIKDGSGNDIYFKGMNLGNWLLWEGYLMMGYYGYRTHSQFLMGIENAYGPTKAKEIEHEWLLNYVTEQTIIELKNLGFNSVRIPFHHNMFWDGNNTTDHGFQYFDRLIQYCKNQGMYILLDILMDWPLISSMTKL